MYNPPYDPGVYWHNRGGDTYMDTIAVPEYRIHWAEQEKFVRERVLIHKPERLLDFGCGTGKFFQLWYDEVRYPEGYDISTSMLATAKKKIIELWGEQVREWQFPLMTCGLDRTRLPFRDGYFDAIVACEVLAHILPDELERTVKDLARILKPGGVLALVVPMPFKNGATHNFSHDYNSLLPKHFKVTYDFPCEPYRHMICEKPDA